MKKELIKRIEELPAKDGKGRPFVDKKIVIGLIQNMDEPKQATLTDIIERIQGMEENLKALWLHKILKELGSDFEQKKFQEGFKLGSWIGRQLINADKIRQELNKPVIPQFVADWLKKNDWREETSGKQSVFDVFDNLTNDSKNGYYKDVKRWIDENGDLFARAWLDGYEVEKEPKYIVKIKGILKANEVLNYKINEGKWVISSGVESTFYRTKHTRKQLEEAGFGWVFDCSGIEVEEVTE